MNWDAEWVSPREQGLAALAVLALQHHWLVCPCWLVLQPACLFQWLLY